ARYIGELGQCPQLAEKTLRPDIQFVDIRILQRILVQTSANAAADRDVLRGLQVKYPSFHLRQLRPKPIDDLDRRSIALVVGLEPNEEPPGIGRTAAAASEHRSHRRNVGIALDYTRQ